MEDSHDFSGISEANENLKEALTQCIPNNKLDKPDYWMFLMYTTGAVNSTKTEATFKGRCFEQITLSYHETGPDSFDIIAITKNRTGGLTCFVINSSGLWKLKLHIL